MLNPDAVLLILSDSEVNMEGPNNLDILEDVVGNLRSIRCRQRFEIFSKFKEGFGDRFNDIEFLNYETGSVVKGAELRDAQTGCEIYERLGWDSADFNKEGFHKCGCELFDEQLCFVSEKGKPLSNTDYRITLGDGRTVSGTTDNDGKTKRIKNTQKEQPIEKVDFFVSERIQPLCPKNHIHPGTHTKKVALSGVTTNKTNVGSSVKTVTVEGTARKLTSGEIAMCRPIFKDSIFYSEVYVHKEDWLPFGIQDKDTAMSPDGEIYFPTGKFSEDFSKESGKIKIWFMHEMAHVWQWNRGYRGRLKAKGFLYGLISWSSEKGSRWVYEYYLPENKDKKMPEFNMEQQAEIISHYYGAKFLKDVDYTPRLPFLERALSDFLREPRAVALLPEAG